MVEKIKLARVRLPELEKTEPSKDVGYEEKAVIYNKDGSIRKQRGGKRAGAGRKGAKNKLSLAARQAAARTGELPHEFLLRVSRGKVRAIDGEKVDLAMRLEAAKAAAPYYAPKLTSVSQESKVQVQVLQISQDKLKSLSPEELDVLERVLDRLQRSDTGDQSGEVDQAEQNLFAATLDASIH